ncbi:hypothetical protein [Arthrobacter russicus]|uniref:Histidine kinase n=1 Tax=Arthrobacter russicus TaxID=172040 RepID=A0ABU1JF00_9MICC|nr:hypothetical protein [Arthrobacter russicus]MDR6270943.1 hypothetical protein [Arthrobacter russicus]
MPDDESIETARDRIADHRARSAFEADVDSDPALANLPFAQLWFAPGVAEVGLFTDDDRVVMVAVDVNDLGHRLRTGPLSGRPLDISDTVAAAPTLGLPENEAAQLLARIEQSLRIGITAYSLATAEYDAEERRLTQNMNVLTDGLERIQRNNNTHVTLAYEDPLTFGGGHFVLYPSGNTRSRFTIEEQYTGTDWSDPDRLPTSWAWRAERHLPNTEGTNPWRVSARGEVQSDDVAVLLTKAAAWARRTRDIAVRSETLKQNPPSRGPLEPPHL